MEFTRTHIDSLPHLYKINLINSCSGYKSANLIGSISKDGQENVAVFSSVTHFGSNPPLLGLVFRPLTVPRNTYVNIKETGYFTINHIQQSFIEDAHHTSAKYEKDISEFSKTNLTPEYLTNSKVPFVKESSVKMLMKYEEEYHIKANNTLLLLGAIEHLFIEDSLLHEDGFIDLAKANTATINGLDGYACPKENNRHGYQRPKQ